MCRTLVHSSFFVCLVCLVLLGYSRYGFARVNSLTMANNSLLNKCYYIAMWLFVQNFHTNQTDLLYFYLGDKRARLTEMNGGGGTVNSTSTYLRKLRKCTFFYFELNLSPTLEQDAGVMLLFWTCAPTRQLAAASQVTRMSEFHSDFQKKYRRLLGCSCPKVPL